MKTTSNSKAKKSGKLKSSSIFSNNMALLFIILFAGIAALFIFKANAAKPTTPAVTLSLVSSSSRVSVNQTFTVDVILNTNNQAVNAVQADLTYPTNRLEFVSIDATTSAFEVQAPSGGGAGTVSIVRGSTTPLNSSNLLVGKITFKAIAAGRKTAINYASTSQVMRADDSTNILQKMTGVQVNIQ